MTMAKRNALGAPFHCADIHIPNHSPPIVMNPNCQVRKPSVNPATEIALLRWNAPAGARTPGDGDALCARDPPRGRAQVTSELERADPAENRRQRFRRNDDRVGDTV